MFATLRHQWNGAPFISGAARNPTSRSTSHEWDKDKAESVKTVEGALVASRNRDSIEGGPVSVSRGLSCVKFFALHPKRDHIQRSSAIARGTR